MNKNDCSLSSSSSFIIIFISLWCFRCFTFSNAANIYQAPSSGLWAWVLDRSLHGAITFTFIILPDPHNNTVSIIIPNEQMRILWPKQGSEPMSDGSLVAEPSPQCMSSHPKFMISSITQHCLIGSSL